MLLTHKIIWPTTPQTQKSMTPMMPARPTMPPVVQLDENMLWNMGIEFVTSGMHWYYCWMTKLIFPCHVHWQDLSNYIQGVSIPWHEYTWEPTCTSALARSTPAIAIHPCMMPFGPSMPQPADTLASYFDIMLKPRRRQACPEQSFSTHLGAYHNVVHWVHRRCSPSGLQQGTNCHHHPRLLWRHREQWMMPFHGWGTWNHFLVHADIVLFIVHSNWLNPVC